MGHVATLDTPHTTDRETVEVVNPRVASPTLQAPRRQGLWSHLDDTSPTRHTYQASHDHGKRARDTP